MSSKYDIVHINPEVPLPSWDETIAPEEVEFQSKTLDDAFCLRNVHIALDGLYIEDFDFEEVPLEERPEIKSSNYTNPETEASPLEKAFGSLEKTNIELVKKEFSGEFTFYTSKPNWYKYVVVYKNGTLQQITHIE